MPIKQCDRHTIKSGYTLVEMSVVLVIVALLIGGILSGKTLIRAAELRNTISQVDSFKQAIRHFRDQYGDFPGDFPTAIQLWGAADSGDGLGVDCRNVQSTNTSTCNGDGNGQINAATASANEQLRMWQHLTNSELLEGHFTGAYNGSGALAAGTNSPEAPVTGGAYEVYYQSSSLFGRTGHIIKLGTIATTTVDYALLSPMESGDLDDKYDDGNADSGNMMAVDSTNRSGCVSNGTSFTAPSSYLMTSDISSCRLYFWVD